MSRKWNAALMLAVVGMVFIGASLLMPWWGTYSETEGDDYYSDSGSGIPITFFSSIYGVRGSENTYGLFMATTFLMILAMMFAALQVASILQASAGNGSPKLPALFGILAMVFCLLAPVIFAAALPGAMEADARQSVEDAGGDYESPDGDHPTKSFFGENTEKDDGTSETEEWGGDIGWVLAFVAFAMMLVSMILSLLAARGERGPAPPRGHREAPPQARPYHDEGYRAPPSREELYGPPRRDPYGPPGGHGGYGGPPPPPPPSYGGGYGRPPQYGY